MGAAYVGILVLHLANVLTAYTLWMLQSYLTDVWKLSFTHAAGILNIWKGIIKVLPVGFGFFVDTFLGNYGMLVLSSLAFCLGLGLLSASTPPVLVCYLGTCKNYEPDSVSVSAAQKVLFYTALALIALGRSGYSVSANPFLSEQRENNPDVNAVQGQSEKAPDPDGNAMQGKQSENDSDVQGKQSLNDSDVHLVQDKQSFNDSDVHLVQDKQSLNDSDVHLVQDKQSFNDSDVHLVKDKQSENDLDVQGKQSENDPEVNEVHGKQSENALCWHWVQTILVVIMSMIGGIGIPYIKAWSIKFAIPAIYAFVATLVFLCISCLYKISKPKGSPWTNVCRVFVASALNKKEDGGTAESQQQQQITNTRFLRCLEKAALPKKNVVQEKNRWRHCTISEVEEAQIVVRTIPMWMTFVVCGIVSSIGNTYFVEQAKKLDGNLGKWKAPAPVLRLLYDLAKNFIFVKLYTYMTDCFPDRCKKYAPPVGIAMAMVFSILCCITATKVETQRLNVIRTHHLLEAPKADIPMSMFWLILPFFFLAGLDAFFEEGVKEFFMNQAPKSMRNYLNHFSQGVLGLGFMGSVVSVHVVGKVTREKGHSWFEFTLSQSRLDKYYWVLVALSSANLLVYILIAFCYRYKDPEELKSSQQDNENEINEDYGGLVGPADG